MIKFNNDHVLKSSLAEGARKNVSNDLRENHGNPACDSSNVSNIASQLRLQCSAVLLNYSAVHGLGERSTINASHFRGIAGATEDCIPKLIASGFRMQTTGNSFRLPSLKSCSSPPLPPPPSPPLPLPSPISKDIGRGCVKAYCYVNELQPIFFFSVLTMFVFASSRLFTVIPIEKVDVSAFVRIHRANPEGS